MRGRLDERRGDLQSFGQPRRSGRRLGNGSGVPNGFSDVPNHADRYRAAESIFSSCCTCLISSTVEPEDLMKTARVALYLAFAALSLHAQGAPPQAAANQPYTMEYYYKTQWGHQQEFMDLFLKNHYPLLQKEVDGGRMLSVKIETPANHMTEDARWDYRVTITFRNSTVATTANPEEASLIKSLWPDQGTYTREEQRRFAILLAHWDLPVSDVTPRKK
jgi:hypothetical protein